MTRSPLSGLRIRLTLWYLCTLTTILLLLGTGLYFQIGHRFNRELSRSLRDAAAQLAQAARTREMEASSSGRVVDAVEELRIADRSLYLIAADGTPITPHDAASWIRDAAVRAATTGSADLTHRATGELQFVLHAERFTLASGAVLAAVAVASQVELEDRYAELITEFGAMALGAIVLVATGCWILVRQSTLPIESTMARMRQFMADAAHELRTPVTVLRTRAELSLERPRTGAEYIESLQVIGAESQRLGRIVDDLLILARADAGERTIRRERIFLDDIVANAVGAVAILAAPRDVAVTMLQFDEAAIDGDPELVRQLVVILLDNAVKFTAPGGEVRVAVGAAGNVPQLRITDTGVGITAEQLPHIFERFYRGDAARSRAAAGKGGSGLGLAIGRWIADGHDAELEITSVPGEGTTAVVRFPRSLSSS